jgi:hypothetical protein
VLLFRRVVAAIFKATVALFLREGLFRLTGTDLTRIDSIDVMTATTANCTTTVILALFEMLVELTITLRHLLLAVNRPILIQR